ncbi:MAG TPA: SCP2 sterol-binding domain-containing protein [Nocardioides sp.]|nr:SCP2 sterol-binding domain-containing protein [Nocardioides sp.]
MGLRLDALARASADEATQLLGTVAIGDLVDALRATPDAELDALVGRDEIRLSVISAVLRRLPEQVIAEQVRGVSGTAAVEVEHRGRVIARSALVLTDGDLAVETDVPPSARADVVFRAPVVAVARLLTGERNAGLEYLAGRLAIDGDADLALALGGMFPAPGPGQVPVDPRALDPGAVAKAIEGTSTDHLRAVMSSGFRRVVLDEIFRQLPSFVNHQRARGLRSTVGFRLTDRDEGVERYVVTLADGKATVVSGPDADALGREERDATVTAAAHDFLRLVTGHLSPVTGVLRGQLKVRGDKAAALRLAGAFDIPSAATG